MKSQKIPARLQPILWSVDVNNLNIEKDKNYIIHQVLAYGRFEDILWILKTYPKKEINDTFLHIPFKDYHAPRFYFIKDFILGLKNRHLNELLYVKNIPRNIRYS